MASCDWLGEMQGARDGVKQRHFCVALCPTSCGQIDSCGPFAGRGAPMQPRHARHQRPSTSLSQWPMLPCQWASARRRQAATVADKNSDHAFKSWQGAQLLPRVPLGILSVFNVRRSRKCPHPPQRSTVLVPVNPAPPASSYLNPENGRIQGASC